MDPSLAFAGPTALGAGGIAMFAAGTVAATRIAVARIERRHPPHGRIVTVDGARVHVVDPLGDAGARAPVVVLLHGAFGSALDWHLVQARLTASGMRAIAVDRPGHGHSDRPRAVMGPADQAAWLRDALATIGIARVDVLAGFSFGGAVALAWALDHPRDVRALALVNPATHPWGTGHSALYDLLGLPFVGRAVAESGLTWLARRTAKTAVERGFAPEPVAGGYRGAGVVELATRPVSLCANANDIRTLDAALVGQSARYDALRQPLEILVSSDDRVVGPAIHARPLAARVPHARIEEVADAGHQLPWTRSERVAATIHRASSDGIGEWVSG